MPPERPCIGFFPALPLEKNIQLGEWVVGTPPPTTPWASDRFKELSQNLIASFEKRRFKGGAMLWHHDRGFDGIPPSRETLYAIGRAVTFSVLDANDRLHDDENKAIDMATAENGDLHVQPIETKAGYISHVTGGALRQFLVGGWKIGMGPPPLADAVLPVTLPVPASPKLAAAVFTALSSGAGEKPHVRIAAEWHRAAMANPNAVTTQQRLIAIKTGFEALLGESWSSWDCAKLLRKLFEETTAGHVDLFPSGTILWSPQERIDLPRPYGKKKAILGCSEIQDWFMTLADARNDVIHKGRLTIEEYSCVERPLSRYTGNLFWKGERLLREAIKAALGADVLLCGLLARRAMFRAAEDEVRAFLQDKEFVYSPDEDLPAPSPPEAAAPPGTKNLPTLLAALTCPAANMVRLSKSHGSGGSADLEVARQMAAGSADKWGAEFEGRDITISKAERDLLETAGAEEELNDDWLPCD